jgi:DNA polymerase-3 subunit chi
LSAPRIEFHTGVEAPLHFACRLLRKAWNQGVALAVTAPAAALQALDRELWTFEAQEFVPHMRVRPDHPPDAALRRTPIWLCEHGVPTPGPAVLVNLGAEAPEVPERFERIIEIVAADAEERQRGRARWRGYESRGWSPQHHAHAADGGQRMAPSDASSGAKNNPR